MGVTRAVAIPLKIVFFISAPYLYGKLIEIII
jgi:hypothetical protein